MSRTLRAGLMAAMAVGLAVPGMAQDGVDPFLGRWALDLPGSGAGWLEVTNDAGWLDGSVLWYGGSVLPLDSVYLDQGTLRATRNNKVERKDADGAVVRTQFFADQYTLTVDGDTLSGTRVSPKSDGTGADTTAFTGKRIPPLPSAPDLSKVKYGEAVKLFNGKDLDGWKLTGPAKNGWRAENGVLINEPKQTEGKPKISYGNLRTVAEFEDFNLRLEVSVPPNGNSGVYLRGVYEVQVLDSFGKPVDPHNMGAVYSRIAPLASAEKPAGEWQTMDITLVDRHLTVVLNGVTIHDNVPLPGCTGGALWSDEFRPGPIYLQGDHTGVQYRNITLRPVVK
ncbi:MAG: DUF1080 domain-containing protein [Candidatus Hydrogenedens sp.]|nr:DUF1080 domain-containing protein [Candidatus Hydrogenedentota bacterium]NLF58407.1 DUF1080 domain-containing protein [Candidatus Hydrogenedens sp.]